MAHLALELLDGGEVGERAERTRLRVVEHRVDQRQRADPAVARLLQVGGGDGGHRAAEAQPDDVDRLRPGDLADHVERGLRPVDQVVVHRRLRHVGGRVDVADREDGAPVLHGPLDEAAARREIHDVVLVDPRRARQQRRGVHLLGLGLVLQQLHQVVAEHHLRRGHREVAAHLEAARVHLARPAAVVAQVVEELPRMPSTRLPPPVSNARLSAAGLDGQEVGGRQRVQHQVDGHPRLDADVCRRPGRPRRPRGPTCTPPGRSAGCRRRAGCPTTPDRRSGGPWGRPRTGGSISAPTALAPATSGIRARSVASCIAARAGSIGLVTVARIARSSASPNPAASMSCTRPDSGASTPAARSATSRAGSEMSMSLS